MTERSSEILWLTRGIAHTYAAVSKAVSKYRYGTLSNKEIDALVSVYLQPDLSLSELAARRYVTKGAMSQLVSKLESKGLVVKRQSPESASQICLQTTEEGNDFVESFRAEFRKHDRDIRAVLSEEMSEEEVAIFKKGLAILSNELLDRNMRLRQSE